jgi:hypothetical protein
MGRKSTLLGAAFLSLAVATVACGDASTDPGGAGGPGGPGAAGGPSGPGGVDPNTGEPLGADGKPLPTVLSGKYELSNTFDLTTTGVLPDLANDTLKALSGLRENPAQTMFDLLEAAKVPVASQLLSALPGILQDALEGFINDHLFKRLYKSAPVAKQIAGVIDDTASLITHFEVVSTLEIPELSDMGTGRAKHAMSGVAFNWAEKRNVFAAPVVQTAIQDNVDVAAIHIVERSPKVENGRLEVGDHGFSVPLGEYALKAADWALKEKFGVPDLRGAVGEIIDCADLARGVSKRCIGPVCVGHETDIRNVCNAALDQVVKEVRGKIGGINLKLVHFKTGQAKMWDAPTEGARLDGKCDRIDNGIWKAGISTGKEEKPVFTTFVGKRVGDAAGSTPPPAAR